MFFAGLFGADVELSEEGLAAVGSGLTVVVFLVGYLKSDPARRRR